MRQVAKKDFATIIGYCSLLIWATAALQVSLIRKLPTFEILAITFSIGFFFTLFKLTIEKGWKKLLRQPMAVWCIGTCVLFINNSLYISAFKYAPLAQVDLIDYLWPVMVILLGNVVLCEAFRFKYIIASFIGLFGAYLVISNHYLLSSIQSKYWMGYGLAFASALVWSGYTIFLRFFSKTPIEMIGIYCGFAAIGALLTHSQIEMTVLPNSLQWLLLIIMGVTIQGAAYFFWDIGTKHGNLQLLSILSYGNPVLSIMFLAWFGLAQMTWKLAVSAFLVSIAGLIASIDWRSQLNLLRAIKIKSHSILK